MSKESILLLITILLSLLSLFLFYKRLRKEGENFKEWTKKDQYNSFEGWLPYIIIAVSISALDHPVTQNLFESVSSNSVVLLILKLLTSCFLAIGPFLTVIYIHRKRYRKS